MGAPYPQALRDRVLAAYDRGMQTKDIAEVFQVSPAWRDASNNVAARPARSRRVPWVV